MKLQTSEIGKYVLFLIFLNCHFAYSQALIDSIFSGDYHGARVTLQPLVHLNDSDKKLYVKKLMYYMQMETMEISYSGYTDAAVRKRMITETGSNDNALFVPKGVISMYLIYCILLKDTAFVPKITLVENKSDALGRIINFYKQKHHTHGKKGYYEYTYIGHKTFQYLVRQFHHWYDTYYLTASENAELQLPLDKSTYQWQGFNRDYYVQNIFKDLVLKDSIRFDTIEHVKRTRIYAKSQFNFSDRKRIPKFYSNELYIGPQITRETNTSDGKVIGVQIDKRPVYLEYYVFPDSKDTFQTNFSYDTALNTMLCDYLFSSSG